MSAAYEHKIGATLYLAGQLTLAGQPQDMSGWSVRSQMRGPGGVIELACEWLDATVGQLAISAPPASQAAWLPGRYAIDVRLQDLASGDVLISSTREVALVRPETR